MRREGAYLFFQAIAHLYERTSVIITTKMGFGEWANVFDDVVVATAILDRLLHHAVIINITGDSYRMAQRNQMPNPFRKTAELMAQR